MKKYAPYIIFIIGCFIISYAAITAYRTRIDQRAAERISELDRQYSEQSGAARKLLGDVGDGLTEIQERLSSLSGALRVDATDLRSIANGIRTAAWEVEEMENIITDLWDHLRGFIDFYYDTLDQEIERELGIKIPKGYKIE